MKLPFYLLLMVSALFSSVTVARERPPQTPSPGPVSVFTQIEHAPFVLIVDIEHGVLLENGARIVYLKNIKVLKGSFPGEKIELTTNPQGRLFGSLKNKLNFLLILKTVTENSMQLLTRGIQELTGEDSELKVLAQEFISAAGENDNRQQLRRWLMQSLVKWGGNKNLATELSLKINEERSAIPPWKFTDQEISTLSNQLLNSPHYEIAVPLCLALENSKTKNFERLATHTIFDAHALANDKLYRMSDIIANDSDIQKRAIKMLMKEDREEILGNSLQHIAQKINLKQWMDHIKSLWEKNPAARDTLFIMYFDNGVFGSEFKAFISRLNKEYPARNNDIILNP